MIIWMVLPYALCCFVLFSTAKGSATIRANREYNCPGMEVVFTCVVNTTVLSWDLYFLSGHEINRVSFFQSDSIGRQFSPQTSEGTVYTFSLISKSPFTSTMTTIASADLSGAVILCQDGIPGSFHNDTLVVEVVPEPQNPNNITAVVPLIHPSYDAAGSLNVTLQWDDESDLVHLKNYTITVYPEAANSGSIFYTNNASIQLALHYDQDYNISVMASNCVGNSTPAEIHIRLVHCGPSIGKGVMLTTRGIQADKLKTYCLHSPRLIFVPDEINPNKSTLTNDCGQNGSIHQYGTSTLGAGITSKKLIPAMTASHLLLSSCTLIVGLLLGSLSHRCCRRRKSSKTVDKKFMSSIEEPVYSEIPPKTVPSVYHVSESVKSVDNVAYGQVSP